MSSRRPDKNADSLSTPATRGAPNRGGAPGRTSATHRRYGSLNLPATVQCKRQLDRAEVSQGADRGADADGSWRAVFDGWQSGQPAISTPVQRMDSGAPADTVSVQAAAARGVAASGTSIPHLGQMESAFGMSLGDVRAHAGGVGAEASRAIGADAYTSGNNIAFAHASPSPSLVAHELTHVVQQRAGAVPSGMVGTSGDSFEREADSVAATVSGGGTTDVASRYAVGGGSRDGVQRSAVQRYESSEHAQMGSMTQAKGSKKMTMLYPAKLDGLLSLQNGAKATTGEVIAMGDFYAGIKQLNSSPRQETEALIGLVRLEGVWNLVARQNKLGGIDNTSARKNEKARDKGLALHGDGKKNAAGVKTDGERLHTTEGGHGASKVELDSIAWGSEIWKQNINGDEALGTFESLAKKLHSQFAPTWGIFGMSIALDKKPNTNVGYMKATIGRRRFRGKNDMLNQAGTRDPSGKGGDYLDLANYNVSHFAGNNWATYASHHKAACRLAQDARNETDPKKKKQLDTNAKVTDALGCHFLTDMYAAGHMVDKQKLMQKATNMVVGMGRKPKAQGGMGLGKTKNAHTVLRDVLTKAIKECFEDADVRKAWIDGCKAAHNMGLITAPECTAMSSAPWGDDITTPISIVAKFIDVLLSMPWVKRGGTLVPSQAADESGGFPGSRTTAGKQAFQMGIGNLAALQVHHAINEIGFSCWTVGGKGPFRMQGDGHLTAETFDTANQAVRLSRKQLATTRSSEPDLNAIKALTPGTAVINAQWVKDFYQHRQQKDKKAVFDKNLIGMVVAIAEESMNKPFNLMNKKGNSVSWKMDQLCDAIMAVEFTASPGDPQKTGAKKSGTGLNISMLSQLLCEMLPGAVPATYAAASASDLPSAALELYKPVRTTGTDKNKNKNSRVLPTGANDFRWTGNTATFNLNVTGCKPGEYQIRVQQFHQDGSQDRTGSGLDKIATNALGAVSDSDGKRGAKILQTIKVVGNDPNAKNDKRQYVNNVSVEATFGCTNDYIVVYADDSEQFPIGNSNVKKNRTVGNPSTKSLPKATGSDKTKLAYYAATGIVGDTFNWNGNTLLFNCTTNAPQGADPITPSKVWYKTFNRDWGKDYDKKGRANWSRGKILNRNADSPEGPVGSASASVAKDGQAGVFAATVANNPNDNYVIVYADKECSVPLGRSGVQGTQQGGVVKKPYQTKNFVWNGNTLTFNVMQGGKSAKKDSKGIWLQWYDWDLGYDADADGNISDSADNDTDEPIGSVMEASWVADGVCQVVAAGDADTRHTYGVAYSDRGKKIPLGRSNTRGSNRGKLTNLPLSIHGIKWIGSTLVLDVKQGTQFANNVNVYVQFFGKDSGWDHDAQGNKVSGILDGDDVYGTVRTVPVQKGKARITAANGAEKDGQAYAVVYLDRGKKTPLIRSGQKG